MHNQYIPKNKCGKYIYYFVITNKEEAFVYRNEVYSPFGIPVWNTGNKCSEERLLNYLFQIGIKCNKLEPFEFRELDGMQCVCNWDC